MKELQVKKPSEVVTTIPVYILVQLKDYMIMHKSTLKMALKSFDISYSAFMSCKSDHYLDPEYLKVFQDIAQAEVQIEVSAFNHLQVQAENSPIAAKEVLRITNPRDHDPNFKDSISQEEIMEILHALKNVLQDEDFLKVLEMFKKFAKRST